MLTLVPREWVQIMDMLLDVRLDSTCIVGGLVTRLREESVGVSN